MPPFTLRRFKQSITHAGDWEVWKELERQQQAGTVKSIGASNVNNEQLLELLDKATVKPEFVQKRIFAKNGWEADIRATCKANGVILQGFSLLTANRCPT
jgi:diketogulonate reductase-like aldo/keto reductase